MTNKSYYLSSLDSKALERPRRCSFKRFLKFDTGKDCVVALLDPPINSDSIGDGGVYSEVLVVARHEGQSIKHIKEFPLFVFVATPLIVLNQDAKSVTKSDLKILAWGELYRSESDAKNKVFD